MKTVVSHTYSLAVEHITKICLGLTPRTVCISDVVCILEWDIGKLIRVNGVDVELELSTTDCRTCARIGCESSANRE
jgi:hypothetical protein